MPSRVRVVTGADVISGVPLCAAGLRAGPHGIVTATVERERAGLRDMTALRMDVDDAGGAVAILRRQRAGEHLHAPHKTRVEFLAEATDALW